MSESIVLAKNEGLKSDLTQQELLDRFHTLADKELDGQISESEKQELEMIEARLDAEDAEIYAPWEKYQQDGLRFLALQTKQIREIVLIGDLFAVFLCESQSEHYHTRNAEQDECVRFGDGRHRRTGDGQHV